MVDLNKEQEDFFNEIIALKFSDNALIAAEQLSILIIGYENCLRGKSPKSHVN